MKQEISKNQDQSNQTKKSDLEILNIDYFFKLFLKEKKRYAPSLFSINKPVKKIRPRKITLKEYVLIVSTYLKIYFNELYLNRKTMYFFLGGFMKVVTSYNWTKMQRRGYHKEKTLHIVDKPLILFWYMRPSTKMFYMVKLKKLTGKRNAIPKIEKVFLNNFNKDLLPIFTEEQKKGRINKTLYRCIRT